MATVIQKNDLDNMNRKLFQQCLVKVTINVVYFMAYGNIGYPPSFMKFGHVRNKQIFPYSIVHHPLRWKIMNPLYRPFCFSRHLGTTVFSSGFLWQAIQALLEFL